MAAFQTLGTQPTAFTAAPPPVVPRGMLLYLSPSPWTTASLPLGLAKETPQVWPLQTFPMPGPPPSALDFGVRRAGWFAVNLSGWESRLAHGGYTGGSRPSTRAHCPQHLPPRPPGDLDFTRPNRLSCPGTHAGNGGRDSPAVGTRLSPWAAVVFLLPSRRVWGRGRLSGHGGRSLGPRTTRCLQAHAAQSTGLFQFPSQTCLFQTACLA